MENIDVVYNYKTKEVSNLKPQKLKKKVLPYMMVTPAISLFMVFFIFPIFYMVYLSFFDWNMLSDMKFINLENYTKLFSSIEFKQVIINTFHYMILTVFFTIVISLLLALFLKNDTRINRLVQGAIFLPYVVSLASIAFIWMWIMDKDYGLLNYVLQVFGQEQVNWLGNPHVAMNSLVLVNVWKGIGYNTIIFISAMQSVPTYLYEAAKLDGAKPHTIFFKITLPMLSPTLFFLTLMGIIASFKVFETINIMTLGGPLNSTNTLVYYIYQYGFSFYKIGYASAAGVILMILIGIMTAIYFRMLSKKVYYR
ncbi:MAG: carbohydrate ABC transporter permease [Sedimentibacter sp.]